MSEQQPENLGRLDDEQEAQETSSTTDGPAAEGEYDPAQGSPDSGPHIVSDTATPRTSSQEAGEDPAG